MLKPFVSLVIAMIAVALLALAPPLLGQTVPNPAPIIVAVTETSATLSWAAVPGATSYGIWRVQSDGSYGRLWEKFQTVTQPTFTLSGLVPGTAKLLAVSSDANGTPQAPGTQVSFRTLLKPVWYGTLPSQFDQGAIYQAFLNFDGEPFPVVTIREAPTSMFLGWASGGLQNKMLYWNGASDRPVYVNLRIENSLGTADLGVTLNPSSAAPIVPPQVPKRVLAALNGTKVHADIQGFTPYLGRVRLWVKRPGTTFYAYAGTMTAANGGYELAITGTGSFQVSAQTLTKAYVWSNPVQP